MNSDDAIMLKELEDQIERTVRSQSAYCEIKYILSKK